MGLLIYEGCRESKGHLTLAYITIVAVSLNSPPLQAESSLNCDDVWMFVCLSCAFKMCDKIENPAKCEVHNVIWFWTTKKIRPIEIYRQIKEVYGKSVINEALIRKWCIIFKEVTNVHD